MKIMLVSSRVRRQTSGRRYETSPAYFRGKVAEPASQPPCTKRQGLTQEVDKTVKAEATGWQHGQGPKGGYPLSKPLPTKLEGRMEITEAMIRDALAEAQRAENDSLLGQIASLTLGYEFHADVGKLASLNAKEERRSIELDHLVNAALIVALIRPAIEAEAIKQGRKDVVDWMFTHMVKDNPEHEPFRGLIAIKKETWQFQLKEWGIKPEAKE